MKSFGVCVCFLFVDGDFWQLGASVPVRQVSGAHQCPGRLPSSQIFRCRRLEFRERSLDGRLGNLFERTLKSGFFQSPVSGGGKSGVSLGGFHTWLNLFSGCWG